MGDIVRVKNAALSSGICVCIAAFAYGIVMGILYESKFADNGKERNLREWWPQVIKNLADAKATLKKIHGYALARLMPEPVSALLQRCCKFYNDLVYALRNEGFKHNENEKKTKFFFRKPSFGSRCCSNPSIIPFLP